MVQREKLSEIDTIAWLEGLTTVSRQTGRGKFDQALFDFLYTNLYIDHFAVFTYSSAEGTGHLFTKSIMPADEAEELARDYVSQYHQRDPHFTQSQLESSKPVHPSLEDEYDPEYRDHFFTQHDLVDKISITLKIDEGYLYCNFYRIGKSGEFTEGERSILESILPLITSLIGSHLRIMKLGSKAGSDEKASARSLVHSIISSRAAPFDRLTDRESEVCERILVGFTSTGIGLDLGIAESSVNTYRRRAYEKLKITSQNELFSLCISALNQRKTNSHEN